MGSCVVERESGQVRGIRIRIDIREVELESSESEGQFIYLRRANYSAKRKSQFLGGPLTLPARREAGIYRRPIVQRIAFQLLFFRPKHAEENAVAGIEVVVNT